MQKGPCYVEAHVLSVVLGCNAKVGGGPAGGGGGERGVLVGPHSFCLCVQKDPDICDSPTAKRCA